MNDSKEAQGATIDVAYSAFEKHMQEFRAYAGIDLSESDTRSKIIDQILELLGWKESFIRRETHECIEGKFLDYKLSTTQPLFVIEAKKQFVLFEIPSGGTRFYRIGGAIKQSVNLMEAIKQARHYAINCGMVYCCVTNGFQFVFFRATNTLGVGWAQQMVVVFRDHTDVLSRFSEFYDIFSYEAALTGRICAALPVQHVPACEDSRFHKFGSELKIDYQIRDRNALFPYTRELIQRVFQSLESDDASNELLEHCYVESARDSSYERGIGELLKEHKTRIPDGAVKVYTKKRDAGEFQEHVEWLTDNPPDCGNVTLILGTVGAGKTTFLNRFRKVFARDIIDSQFVWIQISFNSFVELEDELPKWVDQQIKTCLKNYYTDLDPFTWTALQEIYRKEVDELRDGVLNPLFRFDKQAYEMRLSEEVFAISKKSDTHLLRCLDYYARKTKRRLILVFDNADQHSVPMQNNVFLLAQKYSQILRCFVFLSLREESYWKNKEYGGLSAFHSTAFQISAPRIEQVLAKRFKYASKLILEDKTIIAAKYAGNSLSLSAEQINDVFRMLQGTLLGEDKRFIRFLEYTSPGEVRRALDFVARFLTSGHTNINRMVHPSAGSFIGPVGFHEFLQAVMLGDRVYYREDMSDVVNLFSADGKGDCSHFNRLAVISRIMSAVGHSTELGKGYVAVSEVVSDCEGIGMSAETCLSIIGLLVQRRILATDTLVRDGVVGGSHVRATSAAVYYIEEMATEFTYVDSISMDTGIGDDDVRSELAAQSRTIFAETDRFIRLKLRVERTRKFIGYLLSEYESSRLAQANGRFDVSTKTIVRRMHSGFQQQSISIVESARIAFGRPADDLFSRASSNHADGG